MTDLTREIRITPSYDHRDEPGDRRGAHGCDLILVLRGPLGVITAKISTGWMTNPLAGRLIHGAPRQRRWEKPGVDAQVWDRYPSGSYVGVHSPSRRAGWWTQTGPCNYLGVETCYGDGSYTAADEILALITTGGSDAAFERLTAFYQSWLVNPGATTDPGD